MSTSGNTPTDGARAVELEFIERVSAGSGEPKASIVILHGLGASCDDFVPFVQELDLRSIGPVRFVFPNAPTRPVTINGGHVMRAWYDILGADLQRREDEQGLRESQQLVRALLDRELARGMPANRIVLAGFSQGCAMTLQTGLRYQHRLAGLLGMSGYLPLAATVEAERSDANRLVPVFLAHGAYDDIIPIARARASHDALKGMGYDVQWRDYPMPHSVAMEEVQDIAAWLRKVLA
jgi:phospholipase/carboxylesterase